MNKLRSVDGGKKEKGAIKSPSWNTLKVCSHLVLGTPSTKYLHTILIIKDFNLLIMKILVELTFNEH
jgi:hypothetical protein